MEFNVWKSCQLNRWMQHPSIDPVMLFNKGDGRGFPLFEHVVAYRKIVSMDDHYS